MKAFIFGIAMFISSAVFSQQGLPITELRKDGIVLKEDNILIQGTVFKIRDVKITKDTNPAKYPDIWVFFIQSTEVTTISLRKDNTGRWAYAIGRRKA